MTDSVAPFLSPATAAAYAEMTPKKVPGLGDLHRMAAILLAERAPVAAHTLVVGAGGGLELKALAEARPEWRFTGVDPSPAMLDAARHTAARHADRIELLPGTVDQAPNRPYDGAVCLLTLHFLDRAERLRTLTEIRRRLKHGARFVVAHHTCPDGDAKRWLARSLAFADPSTTGAETFAASAEAMAEKLTLLSPSDEEALLSEAGFVNPELFYAAFSFRGWVVTAG